MALIWDGQEFKIVPEAEAERLVREDKAQIAEGLQSTQLKFREEFSGYSNRMMATGQPKAGTMTQLEMKPSNDSEKKPEPPKVPLSPKNVGPKRAVIK